MSDMFQNLIYKNDDVIFFPDGIPGFAEIKKFVIVKVPEHEPFEWLVSIDDTDLRFAIVDPLIIQDNYDPAVSKVQLEPLGFDSPDDVMLYTIITLKDNLADSTANFLGPVFINKRRMLGKQIVIDSDKYSVREPVIRS